MTASILEFEHHLGKSLVRHFILSLRFPGLRDLVILAIDAAEIAVAEKDIPRAAGPAETWLFAKVSSIRRDDRQPARVASGDLVIKSVVAAVLRANIACAQHRLEAGNTLAELIRS